MTDRILIKNAIVLSQDPALGELAGADVLVEDDRIAAVGPDLACRRRRVIDATGDIVIPGFIDTHRHTWETSIRTCAPDFALITYFGSILDQFAPHYRPDDVLAANRWGALECLNAGITTLVDWSHIMNTPDHADAAIEGLQDTGIRSVFAFGFPNTSLTTGGSGRTARAASCSSTAPTPAGSASSTSARTTGAITMALATRGTELLQARGRALRLGAGEGARHQHHGPRRDGPLRLHEDASSRPSRHGPAVPEHDLRPRLAPHRRGVAARPRLRRQRLARAPDRGPDGPRLGTRRDGARARGPDRPASDVATTASSDQFTQMHAIFGSERGRKHQEAWDDDLDGQTASPDLITARQVLRWATIDGAKVAGHRRPHGLAHARARRPTS